MIGLAYTLVIALLFLGLLAWESEDGATRLRRSGEGLLGFEVSANGEKALLRQGPNWTIANTATLGTPAPPGAPGGPQMLKTAEMEMQIDPRAEWKQMFNEVWRGERDFFYDRNLHGLDLEKTKQMYAPYLNAVAHRSDLNYLFTDMLNQLTVGHMYILGGDVPRPNFVPRRSRNRASTPKRANTCSPSMDAI